MEGDFYNLFQSQRGERLINIPALSIYGTSLPGEPCILLSMPWKYILSCGGKSTSLTLHLSPPSVSRCTVYSFCQPVNATWVRPQTSRIFGILRKASTSEKNLLRHTTETFIFSCHPAKYENHHQMNARLSAPAPLPPPRPPPLIQS